MSKSGNNDDNDNNDIESFVHEISSLCRPRDVYWCDGSDTEAEEIQSLLVHRGTFLRLNPALRPGSFLCRSDPRDVARVESRTFICSETEADSGPTNNWMESTSMREKLNGLFDGCMTGSTMYVIPFCMGPLDSPYSVFGVQVTDSPYVVANMRIMTRMGTPALDCILETSFPFVRCVHACGRDNASLSTWPCDPERTTIAHFPVSSEVWSFGSGYGGNALLGKKCLALRIASEMGRREGWLAEHCLIMGVQGPDMSQPKYICAGFPSACGKTNLAMLSSPPPEGNEMSGWKFTCVGDDIAWIHRDKETGEVRAINPESGFFGVAPGTSWITNPVAMRTIERDTIFTNVALTADGDVWWEGISSLSKPPPGLINWKGEPYVFQKGGPTAAHPNSRYTVSAKQCPTLDQRWEDPSGVPVSAFLFGGRRRDTIPLVAEAPTWARGVLAGATLSSEQTAAAAEGVVGAPRRDPFAMLPFCGYSASDHMGHWLAFGAAAANGANGAKNPRIYSVNWFRRKPLCSQFIWPGFGQNARVLAWICGRLDGTLSGTTTPLGIIPNQDDDTSRKLFGVTEQWHNDLFGASDECIQNEIDAIEHYWKQTFANNLPVRLMNALEEIKWSM